MLQKRTKNGGPRVYNKKTGYPSPRALRGVNRFLFGGNGELKAKTYLALCLVAVLMLSGCAAADDNERGKYIDPAANGSALMGEAPSAQWPAEEMARWKSSLAQSNTKYTDSMTWELTGDLFISEELRFTLPSQWCGNFDLRMKTQIKNVAHVRTFEFYFVEQATGIEIVIMRIDAIKTNTTIEIEKWGGEMLGFSADGSYAYLRINNIAIEPGPEFESGPELYEILKTIQSGNFEIKIVA